MLNVLEAPTGDTVGHPVPEHGPIYDRRTLLGQLADGVHPDAVYGPAREAAAREVASYLRGIRLDENEVLQHALAPTHALERRYLAYRAGVKFLYDAYYEYSLATGPYGDVR